MTEPHGPLQGVKVVACSTAQAGTVPYMLMADLGAEVIKIEVPEVGDNSRGSTVLPGMPSTYFETNNRGVKSLSLNLKAAEGRQILRKLVAQADIFGQNFRPGAAEKNGFGYEELRKVNPRLVYVSVSGYGPKGPHADLPGTDSMAQALGGIAEAYSTPGQPLKTGIVSVADETCATLLRLLDELFARGPRDDWVERLRRADIVAAPINTLLEASNDPDVLANGYVTEVDYPKHGKRLKVHGSPWHFSQTPAQIGVAPELGAHNDEILAELGYTPTQIEDFRERKII